MQLAEQDLINLDDDVNNYLGLFQLEENDPQPVSAADLLTHTGGFDERLIGSVTRSESEIIQVGQYLASSMPHRVMPPGDVFS